MMTERVPSIAEVDHIAALGDPVVRNLRITQCYHELSQVMAIRTGTNANWCTFATWASKQAGQTIRKEDLSRMLENVSFSAQTVESLVISAQALGSDHDPIQIQQVVAQAINPLVVMDRASAAVARGNNKVFQEIAREFARFYATCLEDTIYSAETINTYCQSLRPGNPPEGQQYLRQAFTHYYQAFFEDIPTRRAELIYLANIEIGYHEQTRLQPEIAEALDSAFTHTLQIWLQVMSRLFPLWIWLPRLVMRLFGRLNAFDRVIETLLSEARRQARQIITNYLMTLEIPPHHRLHLSRDIVGEFPLALQHPTLPDLCQLLERLDPSPNSVIESGAVDWANLPERLHFILDFFRCFHETGHLFDPPFTEEQVVALKSGHMPQGQL